MIQSRNISPPLASAPWKDRPPHDYGTGRRCEHCGGPVNRYEGPEAYCHLHTHLIPVLDKRRLCVGNRPAKLTQAQAEAIRVRYAEGGVSHAELAAMFGVARNTVTGLLNGLTYKNRKEEKCVDD